MIYDAFIESVMRELTNALPGEWKDATISVKTTEKVNCQRKGLQFEKPGLRCFPIVYMEEFFQQYQEGKNLDEIVEDIQYVLKSVKRPDFENLSFEYLNDNMDKIIFEVINTMENEAILSKRPHREFADMSVLYLWLIQNNSEGIATISITNELSEVLHLQEEQLYELAMKNTKELLPIERKPIQEAITDLLGEESIPNVALLNNDKVSDIYVLTNTAHVKGAATILYPEEFQKLAEELGEDLYILPSSRNELLVVRKSAVELDALGEMVYEINMSMVPTEELLSHQIYQYDRDIRQVTMATDLPLGLFQKEQIEANQIAEKERSMSR